MTNFTRSLLGLGALVGTLGGCGNNSLPGILPVVTITTPTNNSAVNLPSDKKVVVSFTTNYTLKAPGACAGTQNCGSVYVLIDSTSCNPQGQLYNTLAVSATTEADFSKCATPAGQHIITLELHHDDGTVVLDLANNPVTSKVTVTTQL